MDFMLSLADQPNPTDDQDELGSTECQLSSCAEVYTADRTNATLTAIYYSSHTLAFFVDDEPIQTSPVIVLPAETEPTKSILSYLPAAPDGVAVSGRPVSPQQTCVSAAPAFAIDCCL